jgi:Flp pilus assembly protein TadB
MFEHISDALWTWPITAFSIAVAALVGAAMLWSDIERRSEKNRRMKEDAEDAAAGADDERHDNSNDTLSPSM